MITALIIAIVVLSAIALYLLYVNNENAEVVSECMHLWQNGWQMRIVYYTDWDGDEYELMQFQHYRFPNKWMKLDETTLNQKRLEEEKAVIRSLVPTKHGYVEKV